MPIKGIFVSLTSKFKKQMLNSNFFRINKANMKTMSTLQRWVYLLAFSVLMLFNNTSEAQKSAAKCAGFTATINNGSVINLCTGTSVQLNSTPVVTGYTYQWQSQPTTGGPFANVSGATSPDLTTSDLGAYRIIINAGTCKDTSGITSVIRLVLSGGTIRSSVTNALCPGEVGGLISGDTVAGLQVGIVTFTWEKNETNTGWTVISGATDLNYYVPNLFKATKFRRVAKDNCGNVAYSNEISFSIAGLVSGGNIAPKTQTVNQATTPAPILSVNPAVGGSGTISYQWQSSKYEKGPYLNIGGATGLDYAPGNLLQNYYFRRLAKDSKCGNIAISDTALVIVTDAILDAGFFTIGSSCVFPGKSAAVLETGFLPSGGVPPYVTVWQSSTDNVTWTDIAGANGPTYQPTNLTQTTSFRKKVTDAAGTIAYSNSVTVTLVTSTLTGGTIASTASVACLGSNPAIIKSTSSPTGFAERLGYQWQYKNISSGGNWVNINGQIRETLIPDPITEKTSFRRVASDACGPNTRSTPSNEVEIDIRPALIPGDITPTSQVIRPGNTPAQLVNQTAPSGGTNSYTISWDSASAAIGPFSTLSSQTALSYQPNALQQSAYYRRVVVDNNCLATKYTYVVEVYVNTAPKVEGGSLTGSSCVFPGNRPSKITGNTPTGGTPPYTYSWERRNGTTTAPWAVIASATSISYTPPIITRTTQFRRKTTDAFGEFAYSAPFTINYISTALNPGTIAGTTTGSVCSGTTPGLIKSVTGMSGFGANSKYQWQTKFAGTNWTDIAGANAATYQPGAITQITYFRRAASDMCGDATRTTYSNEVVYTIAQNVRLLAGLVDGPFITCAGTAPGLIRSVLDACGGGNVHYQWQYFDNGSWVSITGATAASYTPGVITTNMTYRRRVADDCGNVTSSNSVDIYVYPPIEAGVIGEALQNVCTNVKPANIKLLTNCHYTDGTVSYQWQTSTSTGGPWTDIAGATTNEYSPAGGTASSFYRLKVMSTTCSFEAFTNVAAVIVDGSCRMANTGNRVINDETINTDSKVYPNPLTGNTMQVKLESAGKATVKMMNAEGSVIPVVVSQTGMDQMKLSFVKTPAKGMYLLTVYEGKTSWTRKVIVQ